MIFIVFGVIIPVRRPLPLLKISTMKNFYPQTDRITNLCIWNLGSVLKFFRSRLWMIVLLELTHGLKRHGVKGEHLPYNRHWWNIPIITPNLPNSCRGPCVICYVFTNCLCPNKSQYSRMIFYFDEFYYILFENFPSSVYTSLSFILYDCFLFKCLLFPYMMWLIVYVWLNQ